MLTVELLIMRVSNNVYHTATGMGINQNIHFGAKYPLRK
jgi:hypothetical protein